VYRCDNVAGTGCFVTVRLSSTACHVRSASIYWQVWLLYDLLYQVAQKLPPVQNAVSWQPMEIFNHYVSDHRRSFQQSLIISLKYFHCFKNHSFYSVLFCISKLCRRNVGPIVTWMLYVQRRSTVYLKARSIWGFVQARSLSMKFSMALLIESRGRLTVVPVPH